MSSKLNKEKEKFFQDVFYLLDQDKDGFIGLNEVGIALRALGIYLEESEIEGIVKSIPSSDNKVSSEAFKELYVERLGKNKGVNDLIKAFKSFDPEGTGKININDIKHGLTVLGEPLSESEIDMLVEEAGADESGVIDYVKLAEKIFGK